MSAPQSDINSAQRVAASPHEQLATLPACAPVRSRLGGDQTHTRPRARTHPHTLSSATFQFLCRLCSDKSGASEMSTTTALPTVRVLFRSLMRARTVAFKGDSTALEASHVAIRESFDVRAHTPPSLSSSILP